MAAVIFVLGLVPLAIAAANTIGGILDYEVHEFDKPNSTALEVDGGQVAIFTTYNGIGTISCTSGQPGADVRGDPTDTATATADTLDRPAWSFTFSKGAREWHRVAATPDGWGDGTYLVTCNLASGPSGVEPQFGYADDPSILGTVVGFVVAGGIALIATIIALTIAIVVGVKRYHAKRPPLPKRAEFPPAPPPGY